MRHDADIYVLLAAFLVAMASCWVFRSQPIASDIVKIASGLAFALATASRQGGNTTQANEVKAENATITTADAAK